MMRTHEKLRSGVPVLGSFVFSSDPAVSEIYGDAGFDFCVIDLEHAPNDIPGALQHMRACEARRVDAVIRVGQSTEPDIPRLLDAGAAGIMIPHYGMPRSSSPVAGLRYPPAGGRPTCTGIRAASYGIEPFTNYVERSNQGVFGIGLVEDQLAVDTIESLAEDIDCLMPGPSDLASSLGFHGQFNHPEVVAAVDKVLASAGRAGTACGMYVTTPGEVAAWHRKGARLFVMSIDYKILGSALVTSRKEFERIVSNISDTARALPASAMDRAIAPVDAG